jgi:hypothetical protein
MKASKKYLPLMLMALLVIIASLTIQAQSSDAANYVLYSSSPNGGNQPGFGFSLSRNSSIYIGNKTDISGGWIGSAQNIFINNRIELTGNLQADEGIYIGSRATISGDLFAAGDLFFSKSIIASSRFDLTGNIFSSNRVIVNKKNSSISGSVNLPDTWRYYGPSPSGGVIGATPTFPALPTLPTPKTFDPVGSGTINNTTSINPGSYGKIKLNGNDTLKFNGPGVYVFDKIDNKNLNYFEFIFNGQTGIVEIHVHEKADLDKLRSIYTGGGDASQVYLETHGTANNGKPVFQIKKSPNKTGSTMWSGTVYAPFGGVEISTKSGPEGRFGGAIWSGGRIEIGNNSEIEFVPLKKEDDCNCIIPVVDPGNSKSTDIIGLELTGLNQNTGVFSTALPDVFTIEGGFVYIEIIKLQNGQLTNAALLAQLQLLGLTDIIDDGNGSLIISGKFPIANLPQLNTLIGDIRYVRPLYPPLLKSGIATTAGDIAIQTDEVRGGYDVDGTGYKIGVLSDSYNTQPGNKAAQDAVNGDLPSSGVQIIEDYPFGAATDEGRAMLQIIHDIAPGADLAFRTAFISAGDFAAGIQELANANCDIIVDDVTYITEPFFQDGVIAQAVDAVAAQGVPTSVLPVILAINRIQEHLLQLPEIRPTILVGAIAYSKFLWLRVIILSYYNGRNQYIV